MEENEPIGHVLTKGINLRELIDKGGEFQIDVDFKNKKVNLDTILDDDDERLNDTSDEDESIADILKNIENSVESDLLACPEYISFADLATKMIDCVPSGDVKMLIIDEGDGPLVPIDAEVTIHYAAYWEKESIPFDSSLTMNYGAPQKFRLGCNKLLPGLEIGLTSVKGPKARLYLLLTPSVTWGAGIPKRIRNETALFIVSLVDVLHTGALHSFNQLPSEEQQKFEVTIRAVTASNSKAKDLFNKKHYIKAVQDYHRSLSILQMSCAKTEEEKQEIKRLSCQVYVNLAVCYTKLSKPHKTLKMIDDLANLVDIKTHCKGLFYYGKALKMLGDYDSASNYFKMALKLEPKNIDIGKEMAELDNIVKMGKKNEKKMWETVFNNKKESVEEVKVDEDFKSNFIETCKDLEGRSDFTIFNLPSGLTNNEMSYMKQMVRDFKGLDIVEDAEGRRKKISLIKRQTYE